MRGLKGKSKKKGVKVLNSLSCSINYDKAKEQEERPHYSKSGRKMQGTVSNR